MRSTAFDAGDKAKSDGSGDVSRLVAERATALVNRLKGPLGALDPACGDGNLL